MDNSLEEYYYTEFFEILDFELCMKETATFSERIGDPTELQAVIGIISMKFQFLENTITNLIIKSIDVEFEIGQIITAELSFKNKVNLFSSLLRAKSKSIGFPVLELVEIEPLIKAINRALFKCEEIRNSTLHSSIFFDHSQNKIVKEKITSKAKTGLLNRYDVTSITELFNIADYIGGVDAFFNEAMWQRGL